MISINAIIFSNHMLCEVIPIPSVTSRISGGYPPSGLRVSSEGGHPPLPFTLSCIRSLVPSHLRGMNRICRSYRPSFDIFGSLYDILSWADDIYLCIGDLYFEKYGPFPLLCLRKPKPVAHPPGYPPNICGGWEKISHYSRDIQLISGGYPSIIRWIATGQNMGFVPGLYWPPGYNTYI